MNFNNQTYLFIDLDDVMVTTNQYFMNKKRWHPKYDCYPFDKKCVKILNDVCEMFNPILILSSDWKYHYNLEQINEIFEWNKVKFKISDFTDNLMGSDYRSLQQIEKCRAFEILKYVEEHNIKNYVIIDDLNLSNWIPDNFIWCRRANEGIKQSGIKEKIIIKIKSK